LKLARRERRKEARRESRALAQCCTLELAGTHLRLALDQCLLTLAAEGGILRGHSAIALHLDLGL